VNDETLSPLAQCSQIDGRQPGQDQPRREASRAEADSRCEVDQDRTPVSIDHHVAAVAQIEVDDTALVHGPDHPLEILQER
jgi:hypothetical protein